MLNLIGARPRDTIVWEWLGWLNLAHGCCGALLSLVECGDVVGTGARILIF